MRGAVRGAGLRASGHTEKSPLGGRGSAAPRDRDHAPLKARGVSGVIGQLRLGLGSEQAPGKAAGAQREPPKV